MSSIAEGLDQTEVTNDEVYGIANEIWQDVMNDNDDDCKNSLVSFVEYLEILADKASGFVYELAYDLNGTINGAVWQTTTMRDNFECFGGFICLDVMKRGINKLLWLYTAVAMYNDLKQVSLGCEGILCAEKKKNSKIIMPKGL